MKILYLTKFLPYPAYGGGLKRNLAWINFFQKNCEIDVMGFWNNKINNETYLEKNKNINIYSQNFKKNIFKTFLITLYKGGSIINNQYYSKKFKYTLKKLLKSNHYDYVFISEIAMAQYTKYIKNIPILFDNHNVEYELIERSSKFASFPINIFLYLESKKMKKQEINILSKSYMNFFVSERDLKFFEQNIQNKSIVVNNSFDDRYNNNNLLDKTPTIIFVGNLSWKPNKQGLLHFINKVYLKIYENNKNIQFNIIGSCLPKEIAVFDNKFNIHIYENASENMKDKLIDKAWIAVVPIYFGSGTRIKILEYWSHGKCVVSTKIGAEGLIQSQGTFINDENDKLIKIINELFKSKNNLSKYGLFNYTKFKEYYCEEVIYGDTLYKSIFTK